MIQIDTEGGIRRLVIDRPERRNAIDLGTARALGDAIRAAGREAEVRVLVIEGAGGGFSTGRHLKAAAEPTDDPLAEDEVWVEIFHLLHRSAIPSLAVVEGHAVAGGFTLAMGCDFVLATRDAVFGAYEMRHGFPAAVCTPVLARLVGPRLGLEFALFGEPIPATRLHAVGLINHLAEDAAALAELKAAFAGRLAALDRRAVKLTRDSFRAAENMPLDNALDMGRQLNQLIAATGGFAAAGRKLAGKGGSR